MVKCQKKGSFAGRARKEGETLVSHLSGIGDPNDQANGPEVVDFDVKQRRNL